jgi:cell division protein FtsI/penicillin-binding protein 2
VRGLESSKEPAFAAQRFTITGVIVTLALAVLVGRLYYLQVVRGEEYRRKSQSNFVQERRIAHARGLIYDQQGRPLADNRPSHDVYMTVAFLPDSERSLKLLTAPLAFDGDALESFDRQILDAVKGGADTPIVLAENAAGELCRDVDERVMKYELTGALVEWHTTSDEDGCRVSVVPTEFPSRTSVFKRLRALAGVEEEEMQALLLRAYKQSRGLGKFKPALLLEDVDFKAYARIRTAISLGELPGLSLVESMRRRYLEGATAAHLLGFMNEMTPAEYQKLKDEGYPLGDRIGRRGVERTFESDLRGEDGINRVVVDAKGRDQGDGVAKALLGDARRVPPEPGHSLVLSIDHHMQRAAEEGFKGRAGSVVAIDPRTGFVLAMASFPAYDPNTVTGPKSNEIVRALHKNEDRPWTFKALQDHYAPGSTFKAITAIAALRADLIDERTTRMCPGYFRLKGATWRCYNRGGHGTVALVKALQYSCDTYFYSLHGLRLAHGHRHRSRDPRHHARPPVLRGSARLLRARLRREQLDRAGRRGRDVAAARDGLRGDRQRRHALPAAGRARDRGPRRQDREGEPAQDPLRAGGGRPSPRARA